MRLDNEHEWNILSSGTDAVQLRAIAEETVARTRNMCIDRVQLACLACASPLLTVWRDLFDDRMPCRAVELSISSSGQPSNGTSLQQLLQPLVSSKLGVVRYDFGARSDDDRPEEQWRAEFDALWSSWDRPTAETVTYNLSGPAVLWYFLEHPLRETEHGDRHHTVNGDSLEVVESYVQVGLFIANRTRS